MPDCSHLGSEKVHFVRPLTTCLEKSLRISVLQAQRCSCVRTARDRCAE